MEDCKEEKMRTPKLPVSRRMLGIVWHVVVPGLQIVMLAHEELGYGEPVKPPQPSTLTVMTLAPVGAGAAWVAGTFVTGQKAEAPPLVFFVQPSTPESSKTRENPASARPIKLAYLI
jgi:hypothetical protein